MRPISPQSGCSGSACRSARTLTSVRRRRRPPADAAEEPCRIGRLRCALLPAAQSGCSAAEVDPHQHYNQFGWKEGRNPNALFDTNGYLAAYTDVKAASVNPLDHYDTAGWKEGRDPSVNFDTTSYLATYADVAAAGVDPLAYFLQFGIHEGPLAVCRLCVGVSAGMSLVALLDLKLQQADVRFPWRIDDACKDLQKSVWETPGAGQPGASAHGSAPERRKLRCEITRGSGASVRNSPKRCKFVKTCRISELGARHKVRYVFRKAHILDGWRKSPLRPAFAHIHRNGRIFVQHFEFFAGGLRAPSCLRHPLIDAFRNSPIDK